MYTLFKTLTARELITKELPALAVSLTAAELFYKFRSFTLECVAFLATWCAVSYLVRRIAPGAAYDSKERPAG
jgi:hypothetical protein